MSLAWLTCLAGADYSCDVFYCWGPPPGRHDRGVRRKYSLDGLDPGLESAANRLGAVGSRPHIESRLGDPRIVIGLAERCRASQDQGGSTRDTRSLGNPQR